jgi:hypothetical protein
VYRASCGGLTRVLDALYCASVRRIVIAASLTVLDEYILHIDAGIDELLFRNALMATHVPHPGRMAPTTAMARTRNNTELCGAIDEEAKT